jgi:hypothetical protein
MDDDDVFEFIKIGIALIMGFIIIKALLSIDNNHHIKEVYDCCKCICNSSNVIRLG